MIGALFLLNLLSVKAAVALECGQDITDRDGNTYRTIQIGDRCWMRDNLRSKTKADGTCINGGATPCADAVPSVPPSNPNPDDGKGRSCYGNLEANCTAEGALYTWSGIGGSETEEALQGICPDDWHIPTQNELTDLERSVCTSSTCETDFPLDTSTFGLRGTNEGTSLKVGGCSRFDAILGGRREQDGRTFTRRGDGTWLWSSTYSIPSIHRRALTAGSGQIYRDAGNKAFDRGQSLRCVKNQPIPSFCGAPITDGEGNSYPTIRIGKQCWMAKNMKTKLKADGTCINGGNPPCSDANKYDFGKGRSCWNNSEANCATDGALYTFDGIGGDIRRPGQQGICPSGWHIPTHDQLSKLERGVCTSGTCAADFPFDTTTSGNRGTNEGTSLKVGGCSRFNAILTGRREGPNPVTGKPWEFQSRGVSTWLWSSQYQQPSVFRRTISASSPQVNRDGGNTAFNRSQSLRCLKDE